jgi:UDP-N-acetylglucosamine acyltransferase
MVGALTGITLDTPPFSLVSGERGPLRGVNVVGLRRRNITSEVRREIKRAYQLLFWSRLRLEEAIERVRGEDFVSPEVERLVAFIESSKRGVSR